jgi:hypothetical protein
MFETIETHINEDCILNKGGDQFDTINTNM